MSTMQRIPPGLQTRAISSRVLFNLRTSCRTPLQKTTSDVLSPNGMSSTRPRSADTPDRACRVMSRRTASTCSGLTSIRDTPLVGPTRSEIPLSSAPSRNPTARTWCPISIPAFRNGSCADSPRLPPATIGFYPQARLPFPRTRGADEEEGHCRSKSRMLSLKLGSFGPGPPVCRVRSARTAKPGRRTGVHSNADLQRSFRPAIRGIVRSAKDFAGGEQHERSAETRNGPCRIGNLAFLSVVPTGDWLR